MKIFKNVGKDNNIYYSTTFYNKNNGNAIKKNCYVSFEKNVVPFNEDNTDVELTAKINGTEYDVILSCYQMNVAVEPKLVLIRKQKKNNYVDVKTEDLPFY